MSKKQVGSIDLRILNGSIQCWEAAIAKNKPMLAKENP